MNGITYDTLKIITQDIIQWKKDAETNEIESQDQLIG